MLTCFRSITLHEIYLRQLEQKRKKREEKIFQIKKVEIKCGMLYNCYVSCIDNYHNFTMHISTEYL